MVLEPRQLGTIGGYIRRNAGLTVTPEIVQRIPNLPTPQVGAKAGSLLFELGKRFPIPGEPIEAPCWAVQRVEGVINQRGHEATTYADSLFNSKDLQALNYLGVASLADSHEFRWLLYDLLLPQHLLKEGPASGYFQISPAGWQEIARFEELRKDSRIGFVAMSFQSKYLPLYDHGVARGITAAGYEPMRVDQHQHNNRIDDEIIASIKRSRFLVADFTENRGGIYFEAGYGLGLGLPVIWLARHDELKNLHFDTRQFNHIPWEEDNLPALAKALQFRIEATIGRGPLI